MKDLAPLPSVLTHQPRYHRPLALPPPREDLDPPRKVVDTTRDLVFWLIAVAVVALVIAAAWISGRE